MESEIKTRLAWNKARTHELQEVNHEWRIAVRRMRTSAKFFLLRTHAIGDVLLTTPVIRALKLSLPDSTLTMIVGDKSRPILEGNPFLDHILSFPESLWFDRQFRKIYRLTKTIRNQPKDVLILFHSSPLIHLWGCLLESPTRVGFDGKSSRVALTHNVLLDHRSCRYMGDINLDLVRVLGVRPAGEELDLFLQSSELEAVRRFFPSTTERSWHVGIAAGGGQNPLERISVKHWPADNYSALLDKLVHFHDIIFFFLGDQHDTQLDKIAERAVGKKIKFVNLRGLTSLRELAAVIQHLDVLVTNDSSPLHIAVAVKTPVVGLFGPTASWALCPRGKYYLALQSPLACSPCYPFGRFPGCANPLCMRELTVERVTKSVGHIFTILGAPRRFTEVSAQNDLQ